MTWYFWFLHGIPQFLLRKCWENSKISEINRLLDSFTNLSIEIVKFFVFTRKNITVFFSEVKNEILRTGGLIFSVEISYDKNVESQFFRIACLFSIVFICFYHSDQILFSSFLARMWENLVGFFMQLCTLCPILV